MVIAVLLGLGALALLYSLGATLVIAILLRQLGREVRSKKEQGQEFVLMRVPRETWRKIEYRAAKSGFTKQQYAQALLERGSQLEPMEQMTIMVEWWRGEQLDWSALSPDATHGSESMDRRAVDAVMAEYRQGGQP